MSNKSVSLPKRYHKNIGLDDVITDCVKGSDGIERTVTMRGWYWLNLDWIEKNCELASESFLVDLSERAREKMGFDNALQGAIYQFIENYHTTRQKLKNGEEVPDVPIGNA